MGTGFMSFGINSRMQRFELGVLRCRAKEFVFCVVGRLRIETLIFCTLLLLYRFLLDLCVVQPTNAMALATTHKYGLLGVAHAA